MQVMSDDDETPILKENDIVTSKLMYDRDCRGMKVGVVLPGSPTRPEAVRVLWSPRGQILLHYNLDDFTEGNRLSNLTKDLTFIDE